MIQSYLCLLTCSLCEVSHHIKQVTIIRFRQAQHVSAIELLIAHVHDFASGGSQIWVG